LMTVWELKVAFSSSRFRFVHLCGGGGRFATRAITFEGLRRDAVGVALRRTERRRGDASFVRELEDDQNGAR